MGHLFFFRLTISLHQLVKEKWKIDQKKISSRTDVMMTNMTIKLERGLLLINNGRFFYHEMMDEINPQDAPFPADRTKLHQIGGYESNIHSSDFEMSPTFQDSCPSTCSRGASSLVSFRENAAEFFMS